MTTGSLVPLYDPLSPEVTSDPYPAYERLRREAPVYWIEEDDVWVVSRYDDVAAVMRDPATFSSELGMGQLASGGVGRRMRERSRASGMSMPETPGPRNLIASDPPDHTKLRRLVNKAFTPRTVAALEDRIRKICTEMTANLLDARSDGTADLISSLAWPLPVKVIAEMLGIEPGRMEDFKRWSDAMVGGLSAGLTQESVSEAGLEMFNYFLGVVADRQSQPGEDLISLLCSAEIEGERLSVPEILVFCILLLVAGNETTTNLLETRYKALSDHPAEYGRLRADPSRIGAAIEEILRFDSPVQAIYRGTRKATELAGVEIPAGAFLMTLFGSANRDPGHYPDPDRFDIERNPGDHLAFGAGIHLCLGAPLARLEARVALEVLFEMTRDLWSTGDGVRTDSFILRGFTELPVSVEAA